MASQGAGLGMSTVGAFFGAQIQKDSLRYQAQIADINARIADGNARNAVSAGITEESRVKLQGALAKGEQIARIASSGIDIAGSPTALARLTTTDVLTSVDANQVRMNATRAAWGHRFEASDERAKAGALRASASSISPVMAGVTSLIEGAGQVASSWYSLSKQGAFSGNGTKTPVVDHTPYMSSWPEVYHERER